MVPKKAFADPRHYRGIMMPYIGNSLESNLNSSSQPHLNYLSLKALTMEKENIVSVTFVKVAALVEDRHHPWKTVKTATKLTANKKS